MDVDGVLTDGKFYIGSDGTEYKTFHAQDGLGMTLAQHAGLKVAIITGKRSRAVTLRARQLGIDYVFQGIQNKREKLLELIDDLGLVYENVCYIGDDLNDLAILEQVGFSAAPRNAVSYVKSHVDYVAKRKGGEGAVREIIDFILMEKCDYRKLIQHLIESGRKIKQ
ncbi:HAD family hydrolase [Sporolactobacillus sp. THM7-7]|nr:HAD family hydrolase [Sporolactobacillus sp. THM7-7]